MTVLQKCRPSIGYQDSPREVTKTGFILSSLHPIAMYWPFVLSLSKILCNKMVSSTKFVFTDFFKKLDTGVDQNTSNRSDLENTHVAYLPK